MRSSQVRRLGLSQGLSSIGCAGVARLLRLSLFRDQLRHRSEGVSDKYAGWRL